MVKTSMVMKVKLRQIGSSIGVLIPKERIDTLGAEIGDEIAGTRYNQLRPLKQKISLIDVILYVSAITYSLSFLTCDFDFVGLPFVELV